MTLPNPTDRLPADAGRAATAVLVFLSGVGAVVMCGAALLAMSGKPLDFARNPGPAASLQPQAAVAAAPRPPARPAPTISRPAPPPPQGQVVAKRGANGNYYVEAAVNGIAVPMVFDTGASLVVVRAEDAARIGIDVHTLDYNGSAQTANGRAAFAAVTLGALRVGDIVRYNVPAMVAKPGALSVNLLGQTFLSRLASYRFEEGNLILQGD